MGREAKVRKEETREKEIRKILAGRNAKTDDSVLGAIGIVGIHDYVYLIVGTIVREHDGRTYPVEGDRRIRVYDDERRRKKVRGTLYPNEGEVGVDGLGNGGGVGASLCVCLVGVHLQNRRGAWRSLKGEERRK
jgi:hypothetical protein